jgi:hypothetical protein
MPTTYRAALTDSALLALAATNPDAARAASQQEIDHDRLLFSFSISRTARAGLWIGQSIPPWCVLF